MICMYVCIYTDTSFLYIELWVLGRVLGRVWGFEVLAGGLAVTDYRSIAIHPKCMRFPT
jgi:hypothetical protein